MESEYFDMATLPYVFYHNAYPPVAVWHFMTIFQRREGVTP